MINEILKPETEGQKRFAEQIAKTNVKEQIEFYYKRIKKQEEIDNK